MGQSPDEIGPAGEFGRGIEGPDRTTGGASRADGGQNGEDTPEVLRAEIEHTRSEMSETIDAIQAKLNPETLKEQATEALREATIGRASRTVNTATDLAEDAVYSAGETVREAGYTMMDTIRNNPIPSLLAGIGISWLFANRTPAQREPRYRYGGQRATHFYSDTYPGYQQPESESGMKDKIGDAANRLQERGAETASDAADMVNEARSTVGDVIRENPIPTALVGLGLSWMFMNGGSPRRNEGTYYAGNYPYGTRGRTGRSFGDDVQGRAEDVREKAGQMADQAGDTVQDAVSQVQETAGNVADEVQQRVGDVAQQTRYQAGRVEDRFGEMIRSNPLAVGAAAVAVGAVIGSLLPETEQESNLMGPTRDNLMRQARSTAEETMEKAQKVVGEVEKTVQREARDQGLTG